MIRLQEFVTLRPKRRGFHLVTDEIERGLPELKTISRGLAHIMVMHTSAGLTLNENTDPDVRADLAGIFDRIAPENHPAYTHILEGSDDMPAHAKATIAGADVLVPIRDGRFVLGTWQGIFLGEFRNSAGSRRLVVTVLAN